MVSLRTVIHVVTAFDQCDVRGKFTNAKGRFIYPLRYDPKNSIWLIQSKKRPILDRHRAILLALSLEFLSLVLLAAEFR